jgi:hypothetical protein
VPQPPTETLEFLRDEPDPVLERMAAIAAHRRGWINLRPRVHGDDADDAPDEAPVQPVGLFAVFGGGGPPVPLCTWTPGEVRRRGVEPASVGIQHAVGPKAVRWLAEFGTPVPDGWVVAQDHPRRGLVVRAPPDADPAAVLGWLLQAGDAMCRLPLTGWWRAAVYG